MHIDEVHKNVKRSMTATVKAATEAIDYYRQRVKELQAVIAAVDKASADEILPPGGAGVSQLRMDPDLQQALDGIARGTAVAGGQQDPATAVVKFT